MQLVKLIHQLVAFSLEIGILITLGMWGFHEGKFILTKYLFGLGMPLLAACLWGIWAAPKAAYRLQLPPRLLFGLTLFALAAFLLYRLGHLTAAIAFICVAILSALLEWIFEQ